MNDTGEVAGSDGGQYICNLVVSTFDGGQ